ncbi:MAG: capsular polysaccharide synthesis protein [Candidatus Gastranaerophilales bacterium]|nr:capsular polysaccharide synthesis protein [Candidatus Gastranaerophilales bacterium]
MVKFCINKIKKYYPDTIVITEDNINDYITLPDYILEKYKKGIITPTHFSDIIRVCLLDKYGGIWIDSTCYLTQPIPEFILKHECFFIQYAGEKELSSWFIRSTQNNYIIKSIKTFFFDYWKENDRLIDYFLFHKFIKFARNKHNNFRNHWNKIQSGLYSDSCHLLMRKWLSYNFDNVYFNWLCRQSFIHKLTYKTPTKDFANKKILDLFFDNIKQMENDTKKENA